LITGILRKLLVLGIVGAMCFLWASDYTYPKTIGVPYHGLGILCLSDKDKLIQTGGYYASSVFYINDNTPEDSLVLVTEDSSYFYYGERPGIYWRDSRMRPFFEAKTAQEGYEYLVSLGIDYLQISERARQRGEVQESWLEEIATDSGMSTLVWESGGVFAARVYRLEKGAVDE